MIKKARVISNDHWWIYAFYVLSTYNLIQLYPSYSDNVSVVEYANWLFPASLLNSYWELTDWRYANVTMVVPLCFLILPIFPKMIGRALSCFLWAFALALAYSFGKISHSMHGCFLFSFGLMVSSFIRRGEREDSVLALKYALAGGTAPYVISGLWKLRNLLAADSVDVSALLPTHIAYAYAEGNLTHLNSYLIPFVSQPLVATTLWISVIFFQVALPVLILCSERHRSLAIAGLILFHGMTYILLGILFKPQFYLMVLVFLVSLIHRGGFRLFPQRRTG